MALTVTGGMNAVERIRARLFARPEIKYTEQPNRIDVHPSDESGFSVGLQITPTTFTVNLRAGTRSSHRKAKRSTVLLSDCHRIAGWRFLLAARHKRSGSLKAS